MRHLGDITKIDGHKVPIVDIITGGSPCQDLSVAGLRKGLSGERSGLFMEQIRIIKEMHDECRRTNEPVRPRYMVWENVPGAFSSNGGEILEPYLKRPQELPTVVPQFLDCRQERIGLMLGAFWEMDGLSLGGYMMHSFGECPKEEKESHLLQILEERPHPKYCLSPKACQGILNRAEKRGKELPAVLKDALLESVFKNEPVVTGGQRVAHSVRQNRGLADRTKSIPH